MSIRVRIPSSMRGLAGNQSELAVEGACIGDIIADIEKKHPGIRKSICDDRGQVRKFVAVFLNGEDIRTLQGLKSPVAPGDEVDIVVAVAGG